MSKIVEKIQKQLKDQGYRESQNRDDLLHVLDKAEKPLSAVEIIERINKRQNRKQEDKAAETTIYRNIEMLAKEGFVKVISLLEGHNRYELDRGDHHHHLVCTECDEIIAVHMEDHLTETEARLQKQHEFTITSHSLEFFGVCSSCKVNP